MAGNQEAQEWAEIVRGYGWQAAVGAPVTVEGELWGAVLVSTVEPEPFPPGAAGRPVGDRRT